MCWLMLWNNADKTLAYRFIIQNKEEIKQLYSYVIMLQTHQFISICCNIISIYIYTVIYLLIIIVILYYFVVGIEDKMC